LTLCTCHVIIGAMIVGFKNKETKLIWSNTYSKRIPTNIQRKALAKLHMINAARQIETLRMPPGNRLEKLSGDRLGQWSIRINDQWRVCFKFTDGNAEDVEITDYH